MRRLLVLSTLFAYIYVLNAAENLWYKNLNILIRYNKTTVKLDNEDIPVMPIYVGVGYDILQGNPLTNKIDPGFRQTIFDFAYDSRLVTEDKKYRIPNGMKTRMRRACSFSAKTEEVSNTADYQSSLGVHAEVAAQFGSSASFSASADYKQFASESRTQNTISTLSSAQCEVYWLEMPVFSDFKLSEDFTNAISDAYNGMTTWTKVVRNFGTHYITQLVLGGRMHLETKFEKSTYQSMRERKINVQMAAQASFSKVSGSVGAGFEQYKNDTETFQSSSSSQSAIYIGGAPPAGGDWTEWQQAVIDELAPIWYNMDSITNLLTSKYMKYVEEEDLALMRSFYQNAINEHCQETGCSTPGSVDYGPLAIYRSIYWPQKVSGTFFEFMGAVDADMSIKTVKIKFSDRIQGIQVIARNIKKTVTSDRFGTKVDSSDAYEVPAGDYINKVELTYDDLGVKSLVFLTSQDTASRTFGQVGENYRVIELQGRLVGIYGYASSDYIVSIGFISSEQTYDTSILGATFYEGPTFDGIRMTIPVDGVISNLASYGFDNRASSMQVYSTVRICSAVDFGGTCDFLGKGKYSQKRLRLSNYLTSAAAITFGQIGAIAYTDTNYKGESLYVLKDESLTDLSEKGWANRISSIRIFGWVKVCTEVNFGGSCRYFNPSFGNQTYVGDFLNEKIQSITSYDPESIVGVFYTSELYQGSRFVMRLGESLTDLTANGYNNQISSFRLVAGVHVLLCNDINFSGYCVYISTGSKETLSASSNDKVSSIMFGNNRDRNILLNNYWPIQNDLKDVIGSADLTPVGTAKLVNDRFDNEKSALQIAQGGYYDVPDGIYFFDEFTISAWIKPTGGFHTVILDFGNGEGNDVIEFFIDNSIMTPWLYIRNGYSAVADFGFGKAIPLNAWTQLTVTVSNSNLKIRCYINGQFVKQQALTAPVTSKTRTTNYFGKSNWLSSGNGNADLDQIKIFSVVLGENDIFLEFQENRRLYLTNSWSLRNGDYTDSVGSADLTYAYPLKPALDRFCAPLSSVIFEGFETLKPPTSPYFTNTGFTIIAWVRARFSDPGEIGRILDFNNGDNADRVVFYLTDGNALIPSFVFYIDSEISNQLVFNTALNYNEWTHVAVSVSLAKISGYINGQLINQVFNSELPKNVARTINEIGRRVYGNMNDLRIYNAPLSAAEIAQDYTDTKGNIRHYWSFNKDLSDLIGFADLKNGVNYQFETDKFDNNLGAVTLNNGGFTMPTGLYFDGEFSITMWIKPLQTTAQTLAKIFEIGNGVANDNVVMYLAFNDDLLRPYISYYVDSSERANLRCTQALALNTWTHLAFTVSSTKISAYINGVLTNDKSNVGVALPKKIQRTNALFGSNVSGYNKPKASFDSMKIFSVALTADQVLTESRLKQ